MKKIQKPNFRPIVRRSLLASLVLVLTGAGPLCAQDNIVALGRVSGAGALVGGTSSVGAVIAPVRNAAGDYTITITAAGAFTGADANDFAVQTAIASAVSADETIKADVSAVTDDTLTLEVRVDDVENNPNGHLAADADFFFTVLRIPSTAVANPSTPYLLATGKVNAAGGLVASIGRDGVIASSALNAAGDFAVTLTKPGGFVGDSANDYVLALTLEGSGAAGFAIRGDVSSVAGDGTLVLNVRTDDVQDVADANDALAASRAFFFSVFKVTAMPAGTQDTSALVANSRVNATGTLLSSTNSFDGGTITSAQLGTGSYRVTVTSTGAFSSRTAADFVAHATLNQGASDDKGIMTQVILANASTLHIDVAVTDLEVAGVDNGVAADAGFYLSILDTVVDLQPDLRIGRGPSLSRMKGNDVYNLSGRGQALNLKLEKLKWSRYHFALENDGEITDRIRLSEILRGKRLRTKYFRLTGGRKNVTGSVIRAGLLEPSLAPGEIIRYQGWVKYRSPKQRRKQGFRLVARSLTDRTKADAVRVNVRGLPWKNHSFRQGSNFKPRRWDFR